eukprot:TRINITY_DN48250_c0_g1_i1.p1 TRINITY_DN48250_c0_g1~~TRINITY_DN48250_c0_g1_i1.p1  ORF type:complete len:433 (-),score=114.49 TRINITY_DN48250_c0_g1_i1:95-1393(-)
MAEDKSVAQIQAASARLLQNSPAFADKLAGKTQPKATAAGRDDKDSMIADLQRRLENEKDKNRSLEDQYKYRVATFVKRETQTKNKIDSLERRLNDGTDQDEHVQRMAMIENMHKTVISRIERIQNNTAEILQDQERELMRAFRAKLQDVSKDIDAQRSRNGENSTELQARHRRVVAEKHEAQELAQTFDKMNRQLKEENAKLLEKLQTREDDRQALIRELFEARKEAARIKAQCKEVAAAAGGAGDQQQARDTESQQAKRRSFSQRQIEQARLQQTQNKQYEREVRYREAVTRLKRMVEAERKASRSLRQQQADMLQQRTELEVLLKQCLDDVKAEIMNHRLENERKDGPTLPGPGQPINSMSVHELTAQDRERVLELLLSQQRVVQLLYSKTLPNQMPTNLGQDPAPSPGKATAKEDDFSWLSDIIQTES